MEFVLDRLPPLHLQQYCNDCICIFQPRHDGNLFHILAASRIIFIPLILLCNGSNKNFPTLFNNDAYYIVIQICFAFFAGYYGSLTLMYYPK